jgi:hypothetical protein
MAFVGAYTCGWMAYLILLACTRLIDGLRQGKFNIYGIVDVASSVLQALVLALLWPLTAWAGRMRLSFLTTALVPLVGAAVFDAVNFALLWLQFGSEAYSWIAWPMLYGTIIYGLIATTFHMVRLNHTRHCQAQAIERAHGLLVKSELNTLRSKLNPHFLFNTLQPIIALTRKDPGTAETTLCQFSDMLRYVLDTEKDGRARVTLKEEFSFVRDYLDLEALRLGPRLHVDWELDDAASGLDLPPLSLQPLVENSIKHAFNPYSRPGRLLIHTQIAPSAQVLTITVRDNGPGA